MAGLMYLGQVRRLKRKRLSAEHLRLPSLEWLRWTNSRAIVVSMLMLGAGVLSGMVLNLINFRDTGERLSWSDPVVLSTWLLFLWLLAAVILSTFSRPVGQGHKVAYLTPASFVFFVLMLAVGLLMDSRHWGQGGPQERERGGTGAASTRADPGDLSAPFCHAVGRCFHPEADHADAGRRVQPSRHVDRASASGWPLRPSKPARRWTIGGGCFPASRRCCCRPATGWKSTRPQERESRPAASRSAGSWPASMAWIRPSVCAHLYNTRDEAAVRHCSRVAASLDSMVLGEPQILAQVKQAYQVATEQDNTRPADALRPFRRRCASPAAWPAKPAIQQRRISIPSVAVADFARQIFEHFDDKQTLVIGAGEMAEETLRYLREEGRAADHGRQPAPRAGRGTGRAMARPRRPGRTVRRRWPPPTW